MGEVIAIKTTPLVAAIDHNVQAKMKAIDLLVHRLIEPLGDLGNPEKLIGKNYETWTEDDLIKLGKIYGENSKVLNNFIGKKEIEEMFRLEAEVR